MIRHMRSPRAVPSQTYDCQCFPVKWVVVRAIYSLVLPIVCRLFCRHQDHQVSAWERQGEQTRWWLSPRSLGRRWRKQAQQRLEVSSCRRDIVEVTRQLYHFSLVTEWYLGDNIYWGMNAQERDTQGPATSDYYSWQESYHQHQEQRKGKRNLITSSDLISPVSTFAVSIPCTMKLTDLRIERRSGDGWRIKGLC